MGFITYLANSVAGVLTSMSLGWQQAFLILHACYYGVHYLFASQTAQVSQQPVNSMQSTFAIKTTRYPGERMQSTLGNLSTLAIESPCDPLCRARSNSTLAHLSTCVSGRPFSSRCQRSLRFNSRFHWCFHWCNPRRLPRCPRRSCR